MLKLKISQDAITAVLGPGGFIEVLLVIPHEDIFTKGKLYVQHKIDFAGYYTPFAHAWSRFWDYFDHTWGDLFPPPTWSVYEIISDPKEKNKLVNMTNNALSYHEPYYHDTFLRVSCLSLSIYIQSYLALILRAESS
jgi:hypothetical protein